MSNYYEYRCDRCNKSTEVVDRCWIKDKNKTFRYFCLECAEWGIKKHMEKEALNKFHVYKKALNEFSIHDPSYFKRYANMGSHQLRYQYCSVHKMKWSIQFLLDNQCAECDEEIGLTNIVKELVKALNPQYDPYDNSVKDLSKSEIVSKIMDVRYRYMKLCRLFFNFEHIDDHDILLFNTSSEDDVFLSELLRTKIIIKKIGDDYEGRIENPDEYYFLNINDEFRAH